MDKKKISCTVSYYSLQNSVMNSLNKVSFDVMSVILTPDRYYQVPDVIYTTPNWPQRAQINLCCQSSRTKHSYVQFLSTDKHLLQ